MCLTHSDLKDLICHALVGLKASDLLLQNALFSEPMNPHSSRERRRRRHHSASDDNRNAVSNSNIVMASSSKEPLNQVASKENGTASMERDSSMRKKRPSRKHTPDPGKHCNFWCCFQFCIFTAHCYYQILHHLSNSFI